ncbi:MAG: hypothetical protein P8H65_04390 [Rhodothermales bacterium]|nr:hypothetical protein [Rhodothermales bacterium]MDG2016839.1 hypothetical protein [Rhodothermales bacterium]
MNTLVSVATWSAVPDREPALGTDAETISNLALPGVPFSGVGS